MLVYKTIHLENKIKELLPANSSTVARPLLNPDIKKKILALVYSLGSIINESLPALAESGLNNTKYSADLNSSMSSQLSVNTTSVTRFELASFPEFALWTAVNVLQCQGGPVCLGDLDVHIRPQGVRCNPCAVNFDMIMKVGNRPPTFIVHNF